MSFINIVVLFYFIFVWLQNGIKFMKNIVAKHGMKKERKHTHEDTTHTSHIERINYLVRVLTNTKVLW